MRSDLRLFTAYVEARGGAVVVDQVVIAPEGWWRRRERPRVTVRIGQRTRSAIAPTVSGAIAVLRPWVDAVSSPSQESSCP